MGVDVLVGLGVRVADRVGVDEAALVEDNVAVNVLDEVGTSVGSAWGPGSQAESNKPGMSKTAIKNLSFIFIIVHTIQPVPSADELHSFH